MLEGRIALRLWSLSLLLAGGCTVNGAGSGGAGVDLGHFQTADAADRAAKRALHARMTAAPARRQHRLTYSYEGTRFGGIVPHVWEYDPHKATLRDTFEASGDVRGTLSGVTIADVGAVAERSGTFSDLKARLGRKRKPASTDAPTLEIRSP
jgi:hypothetical protein